MIENYGAGCGPVTWEGWEINGKLSEELQSTAISPEWGVCRVVNAE